MTYAQGVAVNVSNFESLAELLYQVRILTMVHRDCDLWFELANDLPGSFGAHGKPPSDRGEGNIDFSYLLYLFWGQRVA